MQNARFQDLEIKLNYPYLFCHQDVCKHILVFKDIWYVVYKYLQGKSAVYGKKARKKESWRLILILEYRLHGRRDEVYTPDYPLITFQCRMARNKCQMCQVWPAEYAFPSLLWD